MMSVHHSASSARLATLLVLLISAACASGRGAVRSNDATRVFVDASPVLAKLRDAASRRRSMRAEGRVTYFGDQGRVRLRAVFLARRPASFRLETISPMEQPVSVMTSDGSRLRLLADGRLREGPATPENIARLLPLPLRPEEVVDVLLGGLPSFDAAFDATTPDPRAWVDDAGLVHVPLERGERRLELVVDSDRSVVRSIALEGSAELTIDFDAFTGPDDPAADFPRGIVARGTGAADHEVRIRLESVEVNVALAEELFTLARGPGVSVEPLDSPPAALPVGATRTSTASSRLQNDR